jgi:cytochrome c-type biogenesis protein CcmH
MKRWLPLLAMTLAVVASLVFGMRSNDQPKTNHQRAVDIASRVKCPTCQGLSVAQSKTPVSVGILNEIERQVTAGQSDAQVMEYLSERYGDGLLTNPAATGFASIVWIAPIMVTAGAFFALVMALRRWRRPARGALSPDDLDVVARARAEAMS